jgi:glycosyl transferase, family 25
LNLLDFFDRAYVVNLADRLDRRRAMEREFQRADVGLRASQISDQVQFFPAIRPTEAAPFPSVGAKGCSLSHLAVLKDARQRGVSRVLVLEDDAEFVCDFLARTSSVLSELAQRRWGIVQLGYMGGPATSPEEPPRLVEFSEEVGGTHCYGVSDWALPHLIAHFELQHRGVPGDDLRGPMPTDGTINVFRWLHPDVPRFLVVPGQVGQRSSASDVTPRWFDRAPLLRPLVTIARAVRASRRRG